MRLLRLAPALAAAVMLSTAANAAVSIVNGSFESASVNPGGGFISLNPGSTAITGWTVGGTGPGTGIDYIGGYWQAADGVRSLDLNQLDSGSVSQILTGLTVGGTYTVSFALAGNPDGGPTLKVAVAASGVDTDVYLFNTTGSSHANMNWTSHSFTFDAIQTTQTLTFASGTTGPYGPALDNVSISAVPEPSTWAMMLLGFGGLAYASMRRRKKAPAIA